MEKNDAEYIDRIMKNSDEFIKKILDAATLLEIEDLKKRLYCGIAIKLMSKTLD